MGFVELSRAGVRHDVVFIRHAEPVVAPEMPPSQWQLSSRGKELSHDLGTCLRHRGLLRIVTSPEEKARATALAVAEVLEVSVMSDIRLCEVQRPWIASNFDGAVKRYLQGDLIADWEPVEHVVARFVDSLVSNSSDGPIGVVTHGTAMACLVGTDPSVNRAAFWSGLTMPDAWSFSDEGTTRLYHLEA
jgi:broad specificity phosphatase PhoE